MDDKQNFGSLADKVYAQLEELILSGEIPANETLTELKLSARLGASRTPIREALRRLAQEGLIEMATNKGYFVLGVSSKDLSDIYAIRMQIEGLASRWAAANITPQQLQELKNAVDLQEYYSSKGDTEHIKDLDSKFHELIYEYAQSPVLRQTLTGLHHRIKRFRKISLSAIGRAEKTLDEHRAILKALSNHDCDAAEKLTVAHLINARENMLSAMKAIK